MGSIVYQLLTHPEALDRLKTELDEALASGKLSLPVKYSDALHLTYLTACIKEGMRIHPSVGLQPPRRPPPEGAEIAGHYFPSSARVGINAAVMNWDKDVFGFDADMFNPSRWLTDDASEMERHSLVFGGGTRTCIGKNISVALIFKMLSQALLEYRFELVNPEKPMNTHNRWFNRQEGLDVVVFDRQLQTKA